MKEIDKKSKQLTSHLEEILELNDSISQISTTLKQKRSDEKDKRLTTTRLITRNNTLEIDRVKRPSDREYQVRPYSKMDMDVWKYDQLRGWFNVYATDAPKYEMSPAQTGYMLKM